MIVRVNLKVAKILLSYCTVKVAYLREVKSPSGKYRVIFGIAIEPDCVMHYTTDYLTSKTSYRLMVSVV